jgi:hypothetical protein
MRWFEIMTESEDVLQKARMFVMDITSPLKSQGVKSITIKQILDQMDTHPEFSGIATDVEFVMAAVKGIPKMKIEKDTENGEMTLFLQDIAPSRQVDAEQAEQDKAHINKAALRSIKQKRKG